MHRSKERRAPEANVTQRSAGLHHGGLLTSKPVLPNNAPISLDRNND